MSLLEQKRLQWAAEKEQLTEWNPWGKPGCGAPAVSYTSTMVAQSSELQQFSAWQRDNQQSGMASTDASIPLRISCTPNDMNGRGDRHRLPPLPPSTISPSGHRSLPSSVVSSLGFNHNPFVYTYSYDVWKEEAKKQWLQELDKQREEQRLRKFNKHNDVKSSSDMLDVDSKTVHLLDDLNSRSLITSLDHESNHSALPSLTYNSFADPSPVSNIDSGGVSWPARSFLRGANVPLDMYTQNELTLKRARAIEQQEAIRLQIEERQLKRDKEKAELERRELEEELRKKKDEEQSTVGVTNTQLKKVEPQEIVPVVVSQPSSQLPDVLHGTFTNIPTHVEAEADHLVTAPETVTIGSTYVENRVLTPTKFRGNVVTSRDCASQTDFSNDGGFPFKKDVSTLTKLKIKDTGHNDNRPKYNQRGGQKNKQKDSRNLTTKVTEKQRFDNKRKTFPTTSRRTESRSDVEDSSTRTPISRNFDNRSKLNRRTAGSNGAETYNQKSSTTRARSRSSADYQRKILADEASSQITQRRSLSPMVSHSRVNVTGGSTTTTCDEGDLSNSSRQTRRKRRQWESPGRDEVPHFYTDSPHLCDERRTGRNKYRTEVKLPVSRSENSIEKSYSDFLNRHVLDELSIADSACDKTPDVPFSNPSPAFRSDSPPVPALRRLQLQQNSDSAFRMETLSELQSRNESRQQSSSSSKRWPIDNESFNSEFAGPEFSSSHNEKCVKDNYSIGNVNADRDNILRKLTIIRHNLSLKEQEVNRISNGRSTFEQIPNI